MCYNVPCSPQHKHMPKYSWYVLRINTCSSVFHLYNFPPGIILFYRINWECRVNFMLLPPNFVNLLSRSAVVWDSLSPQLSSDWVKTVNNSSPVIPHATTVDGHYSNVWFLCSFLCEALQQWELPWVVMATGSHPVQLPESRPPRSVDEASEKCPENTQ